MKRKIVMSVMMVAGLFLATSMSNNLSAQTEKVKTEMVKAKKYYCPHHSDQVSDKPGKCAVCGMALVEMKATDDSKTMKMDHDKMKMDMDKKKAEMKKTDKEKMMENSTEMKMDSTKMMMEKKK